MPYGPGELGKLHVISQCDGLHGGGSIVMPIPDRGVKGINTYTSTFYDMVCWMTEAIDL